VNLEPAPLTLVKGAPEAQLATLHANPPKMPFRDLFARVLCNI